MSVPSSSFPESSSIDWSGRARLPKHGVEATRRCCHRLGASGQHIFYTATVATKLRELSRSMLVDP